MVTLLALGHLTVVGCALNLVWEFSHCWLYETCRRQTWRQNVPLLIIMSLKDGFWIATFVAVLTFLFGVMTPLTFPVLSLFVVSALLFSFIDERVSVAMGRWEYAAAMPTVFGVGVTPLLEVALTGLAAIVLVF